MVAHRVRMIIHSKSVLWFISFCAVANCCALPVTAASPQTASNQSALPDITLHTTTRAVVLDVVVTDSSGRPVEGLTRKDLELLEEGQEQTIVTFDSSHLAGIDGQFHASAQDIIVLDELNARFGDLAYAQHRIGKFLRRKEAQLQSPTLLLALTEQGLTTLHETTRDRDALLAALDHHRPQIPSRLMLAGSGHDTERIWISLSALQSIASAYAGSSIRSNVIWISPGFPLLSNLFVSNSTQDYVFDTIRRLSVELLHARMTVYTVDPRGVPSNTDSASGVAQVSGSRTISDDSVLGPTRQALGEYLQTMAGRGSMNFPDLALRRFARETGGKSFWGRNDLDAEVAASSADGAHYYTLSYYPRNHNFDGKFRNISVKVNRSGVEARTRVGYFAVADPPALTAAQITDQVEQALGNPVSHVGIHISAFAAPIPGEPNSQELSVKVDPRDLTWKPLPDGRRECSFTATAASFAKSRSPMVVQSHHFSANLPSRNAAAVEDSPRTVKFNVPVDATVFHLRVVVRDEATGTMGVADVQSAPAAAKASKP